jgi:hypothetical protein
LDGTMTLANDKRTVNPITAFVIRREESTFGLPDGETAVSFIALGFGDDIDGEQRLYNTWSMSETDCLDLARAAWPSAAYIGRELIVERGSRL